MRERRKPEFVLYGRGQETLTEFLINSFEIRSLINNSEHINLFPISESFEPKMYHQLSNLKALNMPPIS